MHEAIKKMLDRYECLTRDDYVNALREILQEVALLGLWRSKFFEHAAFYGGTALRILYGMNRFSEDMDFSLLKPDASYSMGAYARALTREIESFGFHVTFETRTRATGSSIDSAFLKTNTYKELISIEADNEIFRGLHPEKVLKIKFEIDTDPPGGFETRTEHVLHPIPFSVLTYSLPDLFAGKLHAILCRKWKNRVKGRDWYDLVWYIAQHPAVRVSHLESRMRQSGDYQYDRLLDRNRLLEFLSDAIENLDVEKARAEVEPFLRDRREVEIWSRDFFSHIIRNIVIV